MSADQSTLTEPQRKALAYMAERAWASPADLGEAIGGTARMKAQGLGRLGGTMGTRLVRLGLARHASRERSGYSAYAITQAGREALAHG